MDSRSIQTPHIVSLILFFGLNWFAGFKLGHLLTGSHFVAVLLALVMPCVSLLALALLRTPDEDPLLARG